MGNLLMSYILNRANAQLDDNRQKHKRLKKMKKKMRHEEEEEEEDDGIRYTINEDYVDDSNNVEELTKKTKKTKKTEKTIEIFVDDIDSPTIKDNTDSDEEDYEEDYEEEDSDCTDSESYVSVEELSDKITETDTETDDSDDSELDELDEEFTDLTEMYCIDNTEDGHIDYFHGLTQNKKKSYLKQIKKIYKMNDTNIPMKFKVLESEMDATTKAIALSNLDKLSEMDASTGEYSKMDQWINGLIKIPFNTYIDLPVNPSDESDKKKDYLSQTCSSLNEAVYGHQDAKSHILQVIGKWIRNSDSGGNVLAIQGPMGNGKTTLVKEGIAKSLDRPFAFIALGGASDSSFFDGHCFTYEGSRWGRIVDILHKSKCMNPIICFDELDKVSDTSKGDEIINMLIHITDTSQNKEFQDNYFQGVDIDLSRVLFVFSFNDESKINRILKDRMHVIRTKGYEMKDKIQIAQNYLLPEIYVMYNYTTDDISFSDETITHIVDKYTESEEGVRNLKRCLENIVSILNIYNLTDNENMLMESKIKDFKLPIKLTIEHITALLKINTGDKPPENMYL